MATTYNVYFGVTDGMELVSEGQSTTAWEIDLDSLVSGQEYEWRVDSINEYGTTYGEVWSFTALVFKPPSYGVNYKRLIAAAKNKIYYEDI